MVNASSVCQCRRYMLLEYEYLSVQVVSNNDLKTHLQCLIVTLRLRLCGKKRLKTVVFHLDKHWDRHWDLGTKTAPWQTHTYTHTHTHIQSECEPPRFPQFQCSATVTFTPHNDGQWSNLPPAPTGWYCKPCCDYFNRRISIYPDCSTSHRDPVT